jgi:hypothetical protein
MIIKNFKTEDQAEKIIKKLQGDGAVINRIRSGNEYAY